MSKPRILTYDIETISLQAWVWRCGEQYVRHPQLVTGYDQYDIICIGYCWNDGKPAKCLRWDAENQCSKKMIEEFDKIIQSADVTIGKNSDRFDVKHINTQRLLHDLPPMPEWMMYTDDLEKQMRKHFALPSQGLDYISQILGFGGKDSMCMQDWISISEGSRAINIENRVGTEAAKEVCSYLYKKTLATLKREYKAAMHKMTTYCKKDVEDTRAIWDKVAAHCKPRYNHAAGSGELICKHCGSKNITKNGKRRSGKTIYQSFHCGDHHGYAGRATIKKDGTFGSIG